MFADAVLVHVGAVVVEDRESDLMSFIGRFRYLTAVLADGTTVSSTSGQPRRSTSAMVW